MFNSNNMQLAIRAPASPAQDSSPYIELDQSDKSLLARGDIENGGFTHAEYIFNFSKKLEEDLQTFGMKIKQHEDNIKMFKTHKIKLDESILDLQVILGKCHSSGTPLAENEVHSYPLSEDETTEQIMRQEKSAAGILCTLSTQHSIQACNLALTKDVLGIVARLGKVDDDNLSRLLSEYLGIQTMLATVCKTFDGVKGLETYDKEGRINKSSGLHGLAATIGRNLDGRFLVICLEHLRPYAGDFIANDPQRRLDILKPRLPNGECPPGFLGFAVNMINIDSTHLFFGYSLRETLFYSLFSRLQVYRTRADMLQALPCISDGALSLDGGIIKANGLFFLGYQEDVQLRFPKVSMKSSLPESYIESEKQIKELNWKKEKMIEDIKREQALLDNSKLSFDRKKAEFLKFLADSSSYAAQQQLPARAERSTPRRNVQ